jgi:AcrR family transcriptional regulator
MSSEKISTKTRILDTTWKLLEARDKNTRMSDIAKAVGISRQALYLHFPTRAALLIATTRHLY